MNVYDSFLAAVSRARPRRAIVFGSGMAGLAKFLTIQETIRFSDVPGLAVPSIAGHRGQLALATWHGTPVLVSFGRLHFYEGLSWADVTQLVRFLASWGTTRLILTNAAGGIDPRANPGSVVLLRDAVDLLEADSWKRLEQKQPLFDANLVQQVVEKIPNCFVGTYAALTGPSYETPAEIRALAACGVTAVGMSTVREAQVACELGLEVAALSCITNKAAGLSDGPLSHEEVQTTARLTNTLKNLAQHIKHLL